MPTRELWLSAAAMPAAFAAFLASMLLLAVPGDYAVVWLSTIVGVSVLAANFLHLAANTRSQFDAFLAVSPLFLLALHNNAPSPALATLLFAAVVGLVATTTHAFHTCIHDYFPMRPAMQ